MLPALGGGGGGARPVRVHDTGTLHFCSVMATGPTATAPGLSSLLRRLQHVGPSDPILPAPDCWLEAVQVALDMFRDRVPSHPTLDLKAQDRPSPGSRKQPPQCPLLSQGLTAVLQPKTVPGWLSCPPWVTAVLFPTQKRGARGLKTHSDADLKPRGYL